MSKVITWIKSNVFIVVFAALMLVALIAGPIVANMLSASVIAEGQRRADRAPSLTSLEKTQFQLQVAGYPPIEHTVPINPSLLEDYRRAVERLTEDAKAVRALAVMHNSKNRGVLLDSLFPEPPMEQRETLPFEFVKRLREAYESLLAEVGASAPPSSAQLIEDLVRRENQYISSTFKKQTRAELDPQELADLKAELVKTRIAKAADLAQRVALYGSLSALEIPDIPQGRLPTLPEMFNWQWTYWIVEDVLHAVKDSRGQTERVVDAPVKRVLSIRVLNHVIPGVTPSGGGGGQRGAIGFGSPGADTPPDAAPAADMGGGRIDPTVEAPLDYSISFTGRKSNSLYDVRLVELKVVTSSGGLQQLVDALARRNFITVLDVSLAPADAFAAAAGGYIYGDQPVTEATLTLETVWLREWTSLKMPTQLKQALGIPSPAPGEAPAAAGNAGGQ